MLAGVSCLPDPANHAYRQDLADTALAGILIASHYADPLDRTIAAPTKFRASPTMDGEVVGSLAKGDVLRMLDCSRGWAWGYGPDGRVGYVPAKAIGL